MLLPFLLIAQLQIPAPQGYVNDFAKVIDPATKARIERIIEDVRAKSGGEIVVVTLPDIDGRDPGDVALEIGRQWGVGKKGKPGDPARNTGVVILVVPKETSSDRQGKYFISTGQGSEGFINDARAGDIGREVIPYFQQRDYSRALEVMTTRVAERFAQEFNFALDTSLVAPQPVRAQRPRGFNPPVLLIIFVLVFVVLNAVGNRRGGRRGRGPRGCLPLLIASGGFQHRGRGGWGGGGFGGGGFGGGGGGGGFGGFGGGGGFSGGGAGGRW